MRELDKIILEREEIIDESKKNDLLTNDMSKYMQNQIEIIQYAICEFYLRSDIELIVWNFYDNQSHATLGCQTKVKNYSCDFSKIVIDDSGKLLDQFIEKNNRLECMLKTIGKKSKLINSSIYDKLNKFIYILSNNQNLGIKKYRIIENKNVENIKKLIEHYKVLHCNSKYDFTLELDENTIIANPYSLILTDIKILEVDNYYKQKILKSKIKRII